MKTMTLATMTAGLLLGLSAQGAITFVDAVAGPSGNTGQTGQPLTDVSWYADTTASSDTLWGNRTDGIGTGGTILQVVPVSGTLPTVPEISTRVTGLSDGTYDVWVFFQDQVTSATQNWIISAGLTSGALATYSANDQPAVTGATASAVNASGLTFDVGTPPVLTESSGARNLYGVNLGQAVINGGSPTLNVYVDMNIAGSSSTQRVFYDGVGYELVPEPSSLALLSLGGLFFARRRRAA